MAMSKMKLASMVFLEAAENLSRNGKLENPIITFENPVDLQMRFKRSFGKF